ncbi:MAG: DUF4253 domain-containing protein [Candidatus Sericytochromatia bacterium]
MKDLLDLLASFPEVGEARPVPPVGDWLYAQVPGPRAIELWEALRARTVPLGYWPLILGRQSESLTRPESHDSWPIPASREEILAAAAALDLDAWVQAQLGSDNFELSFDPEEFAEFGSFFAPEAMQPNHQFSVHLNLLTRKPYKEVGMAFVPVAAGWEVPAFFFIGGWNACPGPEVHVRLLQEWEQSHGAELVGYTGDVLELKVQRPPQTLEQAQQLARVQYAYCPDIVEQGVQTLENLARTLVNSSVWYFWWD